MKSSVKMVLKDGKAGKNSVLVYYQNLTPQEADLMKAYVNVLYDTNYTIIDRRKPL